MQTLQLNADYIPMKVIRWERAVELVLDQKAVTVVPYEGRFVRSASLALPWPAVLALKQYTRVRMRVRFSGKNVHARDLWTCAYCGLRPRSPDGRPDRRLLTLDHLVPRAHARNGVVYLPWSRVWVNLTCWENAVTACNPCNTRKADRTPTQASMPLRMFPRVPTHADILRIAIGRLGPLPTEWTEWLPHIGSVGDSGPLAPAKLGAR